MKFGKLILTKKLLK